MPEPNTILGIVLSSGSISPTKLRDAIEPGLVAYGSADVPLLEYPSRRRDQYDGVTEDRNEYS